MMGTTTSIIILLETVYFFLNPLLSILHRFSTIFLPLHPYKPATFPSTLLSLSLSTAPLFFQPSFPSPTYPPILPPSSPKSPSHTPVHPPHPQITTLSLLHLKPEGAEPPLVFGERSEPFTLGEGARPRRRLRRRGRYGRGLGRKI